MAKKKVTKTPSKPTGLANPDDSEVKPVVAPTPEYIEACLASGYAPEVVETLLSRVFDRFRSDIRVKERDLVSLPATQRPGAVEDVAELARQLDCLIALTAGFLPKA